jgi:hypothetical protein
MSKGTLIGVWSLISLIFVTVAAPAMAYVGPGAGITMLGALWAVIAAVVLAIGGILIWPIRRLLSRSKPAARQTVEKASDPAGETSSR